MLNYAELAARVNRNPDAATKGDAPLPSGTYTAIVKDVSWMAYSGRRRPRLNAATSEEKLADLETRFPHALTEREQKILTYDQLNAFKTMGKQELALSFTTARRLVAQLHGKKLSVCESLPLVLAADASVQPGKVLAIELEIVGEGLTERQRKAFVSLLVEPASDEPTTWPAKGDKPERPRDIARQLEQDSEELAAFLAHAFKGNCPTDENQVILCVGREVKVKVTTKDNWPNFRFRNVDGKVSQAPGKPTARIEDESTPF